MAELRRRKHVRLKNYDYSQSGSYFVTTNVKDGHCVLSRIAVGRGLAPAAVQLTPIGKIVEQQLLDLPRRYPSVSVDKYVIMPNHLHIIFTIRENAAGEAS